MRFCLCRPSSILLTVLLLLTATTSTIRAQQVNVDTGTVDVSEDDAIHNKNTQEEDKRRWGSHSHDAQPPQQQQQQQTPEENANHSSENLSANANNANAPTIPFVAKTTSTSSPSQPQKQQQQQQQDHHHQTPEVNSNHSSENLSANANNANANNANAPTIPFVAKTTSTSSPSQPHPHPQLLQASSLPQQYTPPQGFPLTARVYTDPVDKLAHFDSDISITLPYWECGVDGSTTVPINLLHATIRHLLAGSKPNLYASQGPHPQILVCLTPLDIVLNSGESQSYQPGDVILLENVVRGGHKLVGHHGNRDDMTVLILTLPQHYHAVGKEKTCLADTIRKTHLRDPCPTEQDSSSISSTAPYIIKLLRQPRKLVLGIFGVAITGLVGDWLGKVATPLLAVFGAGCFVVGGTYGFVKTGEYWLEELQLWQERRQLKLVEEKRMPETGSRHYKNEKLVNEYI